MKDKRLQNSRRVRLALVGLGTAALITSLQIWSGEAIAAEPGVSGPEADPNYDWMLGVLNDNRIGGRVAQGASGNVAVNVAAGSNNLQANQRVFNGSATASQHIDNPLPTGSGAMRANSEIAGQAFTQASGALGVNQVAGDGNAQVNSIALGQWAGGSTGIRTLGPEDLARESNTAARNDGQSGEVPSDRYRAAVKDSAFTGFGGVLQINQVSGSRNVTGNHFSISSQRP